ncbi:MAG: hypothetical protein ACXWRE_07305 [Pseudobdellovibrionaceae bacterium]
MMKLIRFILLLGMISTLMACGVGNPSKTARDWGDRAGGGDNSRKPDEGKTVEKIKALQFQKPTQEEAEFLNIMDLDLTTGERAFFSFSYAPEDNGTFFFSLAQARLHLLGCSKTPDRKYKMQILWQQVQPKGRVIVKQFSPNIDSFDFKAGGKYILSYVLTDLKEFSDCHGATLKFASFLKNYAASTPDALVVSPRPVTDHQY